MLRPMSGAPLARLPTADVLGPLAEGGGGAVFRGIWRASGMPVAIKRLLPGHSGRAAWRLSFEHEARCVASLDHPHVVALLDYGVTDEGEPYLVMPLAAGTLADEPPPERFADVFDVLGATLAGLAHAHAAELVHLDLKPRNLLVFRDAPDGPRRIALSDFGLARPIDAAVEGFAGTPPYMAPEQFLPSVGPLGPWTDLYALGCLAHWLCTGAPPFDHPAVSGFAQLHLSAPPPPLVAPFDVPAGFAAWVRRLLGKTPHGRFEGAADALYALERLGPPVPGACGTRTSPTGADLTRTLDATDLDLEPIDAIAHEPVDEAAPPALAPPLRTDWPERPDGAPVAEGPSRGLPALRTPRMVGRRPERAALWSALTEVAGTGRPLLVQLEGAPGLGRSRLLAAFAARAHETGAARAVRLVFQPGDGSFDLSSRLVVRLLHLGGATGPERRRQLHAALLARGADALALRPGLSALVDDPAAGVTETTGAFRSVSERFATVRALLRLLARDRPLVLALDDVHHAPGALESLRFLLANAEAPAVLCVFAAADAATTPAQPTGRAIERLAAAVELRRLPLSRLEPAEMSWLVRTYGELTGVAAAAVEQVADGNPGRALDACRARIVGGAAARGARPRADDALECLAPAARDLLGLLALAEAASPLPVLAAALDALGWPGAGDAAAVALRRARLADIELDDDHRPRLRCAEPDVAEAARRALVQARGLAPACRLLGAAFRADGGPAWQIGRLALEAGEPGPALEALLGGAEQAVARGEPRLSAVIVDLLARARAASDVLSPRLAARLHLVEAQAARLRGEFAAAADAAAEAERAALEATDGHVLPAARLLRARAAWNLGDAATPSLIERATDAAGTAEAAHALRLRGLWHLHAGALDLADADFVAAAASHAARGEPVWAAACTLNRGVVARQRGELAPARAFAEAAREAFARLGAAWGLAEADNELGELARAGGDFARAEQLYRRVVAHHLASGSGDAVFAEVNLALAALAQGRAAEARTTLYACLEALRAQHRAPYVAAAEVFLAEAAVALGDFDDASARAAAALAGLAATGLDDRDVRQSAARAAAGAEDAGRGECAALLRAIAAP